LAAGFADDIESSVSLSVLISVLVAQGVVIKG